MCEQKSGDVKTAAIKILGARVKELEIALEEIASAGTYKYGLLPRLVAMRAVARRALGQQEQ